MKAVTFGGAMLDAIAIIEDDRVERMTMRNADRAYLLIEEGKKTEAEAISNHCGGGAVNAAVAMARLGADVSTVVKVGQDARADTIMVRLQDEGVSTRWVMRDARAATGASVLISSHAKDAAIFTFRGANTLLEKADLQSDMCAADLVYIAGLSNRSAQCFADIVEMAKAENALVATNPGIRQLSGSFEAFANVLANIDILSLNAREAAAMVPALASRFGEGGPELPVPEGLPALDLLTRGLSANDYDMTLAGFVIAVTAAGAGHVVLTAGGVGAFAGTAQELIFCPALPVEVAGTAGAGDAFAATFACQIAQGVDSARALQAATCNAASVVAHADTQTGLLRADGLREALETKAEELPITRWDLPQAEGITSHAPA